MAKIPLITWGSKIVGYALVDDCDVEWLSQWRWYLSRHKKPYAYRVVVAGPQRQSKAIYMHRAILGLNRGGRADNVDHINQDRLDNRRANLRQCKVGENLQNRGKRIDNSSGYRNVFVDGDKWRVVVRVNGKDYRMGRFDDKEIAAQVAAEARRKLMPYSQEALVTREVS